jgi:hypothetical protein
MKKIIIILVLGSLLVPVKAQLWGNVLKNDTIFTADITGADTSVTRKLRAPDGAYVWYEFPSFGTSTAQIFCGPSNDTHFQPYDANSIFTLDATHVSYNIATGDTVQGQGIWIDNMVGQSWVTLLMKGNSTADTLIIHYSK